MAMRETVLTINAGSSSLKVGVFALDGSETLLASDEIERIGSGAVADHAAALDVILGRIDHQVASRPATPDGLAGAFTAVAHRVVHGGSRYSAPQLVDRDLVDELRRLVPIDPSHLPQALSLIDRVAQRDPHVPQIACFDTAFHRSLPRVAQMYALPLRFWDAGVRRYGFHGLSCEFILESLRAIDAAAAAGRVIVAHLGNGASLTAVREGKSVETTMGFSPAGGLVMGTRLGDVDPTVLLFALQQEKMDADALSRLVNVESGLQGVAQTGHDMRDLLAHEAGDPRAADAVALFCYSARKHLGALSAAMGGLDTLIFTGGIGEHAAPIRERMSDGLQFLGVALDPDRNRGHAPVISRDGAAVTVRVMATDEDRMLARHAARIMRARV
jgi:acetate kinase